MKKLLIATMSFAFMATTSFAGNGDTKTVSEAATDYTVNTEKSTIFWIGEKVTGKHDGTISIKDGSIKVQDGKPVSASMVIDMPSITVSDIEDKEMNGKLVGHLNSADFFNTAEFKEARFDATSFKAIEGAKDREPNYTVVGRLTIKGITNTIEFPMFFTEKDGKVVANGAATFDRSKFDVRYGSGSFFDNLGDNTIYDEVKLTFVLAAKK